MSRASDNRAQPGQVRVRQERDRPVPAPRSELGEARARLQGLGLALVLVWIFLLVQHRQLAAVWGEEYPPGSIPGGISFEQLIFYDCVLALLGAAMAAGMVAYARWAPVTVARLGNVGLGFGLLTGATISAAETVIALAPGLHPGVPAVTPWIMLFPMLVPAPPARATAVAVATALTTPLGMFIWDLLGTPLPDAARLAQWVSPVVILAAITYLPLRMLERVQTRARAAESLADRLGSYQLVSPLGSGGMGEVWTARHQRLARPAAIKLIRPSRLQRDVETSSGVAARFAREAEATAALQSPHTVSVYDFGVTDGGDLYLVMELLEGEDLSALVKRAGPLPPERVVHLLIQACRSLSEAHDRGLVHRDIKPANMVVCTYALQQDFLKILDFGLVKHRTTSEQDIDLTAAGSITGTPAFMAPELATGDVEVDGRADIYALGCVAWFLLTGQFVFDVNSAVKAMFAHVGEQPDVERLRSAQPVPESLEQIILQCLAKAPADRPGSAQELKQQLEAVAAGHEPTWTLDRARAWWDANPRQRVTPSGDAHAADTEAFASTIAS